jgi:hypothetical protein
MVKSPKTGRELEPARGTKAPPWARRFFALFGIKGPDLDGDESDDTE